MISVDHLEEGLELLTAGGDETINFDETPDGIIDEINYCTGGVGPDLCLDAVGLEAHGHTLTAVLHRTKAAVGLSTDRPDVLRQAIQTCRKAGAASIPGVNAAFLDKVPFGAAIAKSLKFNMGQTRIKNLMTIKKNLEKSF